MNATEFPNLSLALKLAQAGFPIFPCTEAPGLAYNAKGEPKKDKAPYTSAGFKDATTDLAKIQGWWAQWPGAVPGIPTGEASGLSVIDGDIDRDTGEAVGERQVADLGLVHADAVKVRTQSGGVQFIYKHGEGARTSSHQVGSHIDTRGAGGYIIAPGARMQNGAAYRYEGRTLSKAIEAGNLPPYPVTAVKAAIEAEKAKKHKLSDQARVQIDTGGSYGKSEATEAETLEVVRALLSEAPNTLCREDWVKLAVSLRVAYGETLRDAFTSFSLGYMGGTPCTAQEAAHVWQSSGAAHTVTDIRPALALLKDAVGPERFKQAYRDTFDKTRDQGPQNTETPPKQDKPKAKFELIRADHLEYCDPEYLIEGLMETETFGLLFGDPGCGKSFAALDIACCIATGKPFHGREVKSGSVIYICGEGKNGIKRRLIAWEKHNAVSLNGKPVFVSRVAAQFLSPESIEDLEAAIDAAAAEAGEVALIIIDTLNRNMGAGDESSTKDMTAFVSAVDRVKDRYQASALVVHHTGHGNKERARGSMSLLGALDAEYRVEKASETVITVTNTKMKDAAPPPPIAFDLVQVEVGRDRMGEAVTSAVLSETEAPAKAPARLKGQALIAMQAFGDALAAHGQIKTGGDFPTNRQCVTLDQWRDACDRHGLTDGESTSAARQAFGRAWKSLQEKGVIRVLDGHAWRCSDA